MNTPTTYINNHLNIQLCVCLGCLPPDEGLIVWLQPSLCYRDNEDTEPLPPCLCHRKHHTWLSTHAVLKRINKVLIKHHAKSKRSITFDKSEILRSTYFWYSYVLWTCWTKPGINCLIVVRTPLPWHVLHFTTSRSERAPLPPHFGQTCWLRTESCSWGCIGKRKRLNDKQSYYC